MYDKYLQSIAKDLEIVLGQMTSLNIHDTFIKKEQRPDCHFALVYVVKFKHLHRNIKGTINFAFSDEECANSVAMSVANKSGAPEVVGYRDDYLSEFMNTAVGVALTQWEELGFSASFEPTEVIRNISLNGQNCGSDRTVISMALDVSSLFFEVVFIDESFEALIGKKILVVDDSLMVRQILIKKLTKIGFHVEIASDGDEAIEKYREFNPDLVIMDQLMPRLSGLDAIVEIEQFAPDAKFIMLSSTSREDELNTASTLNVLTYLRKPLNVAALFKEIAKALMNMEN
ncbi:hypothetical protein A9Q99_23840 [Gammaproteobacteria bacterium 45_16_T64]|nr:hypothetical protein A9Q99_23840 [Gammaproteobacteria bacterium 45_16_T64]